MSSRGGDLPISLNSDGFLSGGGGISERPPTKSTSSPNVATFVPSRRRTSPSTTASWPTGIAALPTAARSNRSRAGHGEGDGVAAGNVAASIASRLARFDVEQGAAAQPIALIGEPPADADETGAQHAGNDRLASRPLNGADLTGHQPGSPPHDA